jgi:recombinational DNA repair ATPase RecF
MIVQSKYLKFNLNKQPILLFDEVCSHLDQFNREILLELINSLHVQTFFTGTEKEFFSFLSTKASYYYINR